jgi:hypothetical protein
MRTIVPSICAALALTLIVAAAMPQPPRQSLRALSESPAIALVPSAVDGPIGVVRSGPSGPHFAELGSRSGVALSVGVNEESHHLIRRAADGRLYIVQGSHLTILNPDGKELRRIAVPPSVSLAILPTGEAVLAPKGGDELLIISPQGGPAKHKRLGTWQQLDVDRNENAFLNNGYVLTTASEIIFVTQTSPRPYAYVFDHGGTLQRSFHIESAALREQSRAAERFLVSRSSVQIGGFTVITAASVDGRGRLWIGTTAATDTAPLVIVSPEGQPLAELRLETPSGVPLLYVDEITVRGSTFAVLSGGKAFEFALPRLEANNLAGLALGLAVRSMASLIEVPVSAQTCPPYQTAWSCTVPCLYGPSGGQNCKTALCGQAPCEQTINYNCTSNSNDKCTLSITTCESGTNLAHGPLTLNCNPPPACLASGLECRGDNAPYPNCCAGTACGDWDRCESTTPILINLDSNASNDHLTSATDGVWFDIDAGGILDRVAWTDGHSDVAFLVWDRNGNGVIDNGAELFGSATNMPNGAAAQNGFEALKALDGWPSGSSDGKIDQNDALYSQLALWFDRNHNGFSEATELMSMSNGGVTALFTSYEDGQKVDKFGNQYLLVGSALVQKNGAEHWRKVFDVVFATAGALTTP